MHVDMNKADRMMAIVLAALGLAMGIGGYQMDRLEIRHIHPASIPGLVPMILGGLLLVCAFALYSSARTASLKAQTDTAQRIGAFDKADPGFGSSTRNLLFCMVWSVLYAVLLVGNLPFGWATGLYIAVFYGIFAEKGPIALLTPRTIGLLLLKAIGLGAIASIAISSLFRYAFLVRLP